jgi:hypothetical protein
MDFSKYEMFLDLDIPEDFGPDEDGCDYGEMIEEVTIQLPRDKYQYRCGATQFVIIADDLDYVVKIPFCGCWEFPYDEEKEERIYSYGLEFFSFEKYRNYCDHAIDIYEKAELSEVNDIFAETIFLGKSKNGYPIYIQEKIAATWEDDETPRNPSRDSMRKASDIAAHRLSPFPIQWVAVAIENYGEDFVEKLIDFCKENVDDLHHGNIGYRTDGTPVIIDYAGYYEGF